jgi:hypothetical protein
VNNSEILEAILTIAYAFLFVMLIRRLPFFRLEGFHQNALPAVFILKILAGVLMYLVYTYFYTDRSTADIFKYFDDSKVMYNSLFTHPSDYFQMMLGIDNDSPHFNQYYNEMNYWYRVYESNIYNDSHTIIRFNAFLRLFSFGYYNVHTVFMCFFSLAGLVGIYRFFVRVLQQRKRELFFAVFLLPSVIFWGSGVLKEGFLFAGLGLLLWHVALLIEKRKIVLSVLFILSSFILLIYTKFYIIMVMLPLLLAYIWCELTAGKRCLMKYSIVIAVCLLAGLNIHYIFPQYNFVNILVQKQHDFLNLAQSVNSGSMIHMHPLENSAWSLLKNIPAALYNSLFRPWFFESLSPLNIIAGLENLMLLTLIASSLIFFSRKLEKKSMLWLCLFFVMGIFILTGLTTPVIGAIVRYKVPALPFLVVTLIMITDKAKIVKRLPFIKKIIEGKAKNEK